MTVICTSPKQQGAVLIVSLIFLSILTILGISSVRGSILQERMSFNSREQNLALQAAEAALRDGELWLQRQRIIGEPPKPQHSCSSNCYRVPIWASGTPTSDFTNKPHDWWVAHGRQHGQDLQNIDNSDLDSNLHNQQPYYLIQELNMANLANNKPTSLTNGFRYASKGPYYYRVSSLGVGKTTYQTGAATRHIDVMLQSIYSIIHF